MESLKSKIYYACKKGMPKVLCDHLTAINSISEKECQQVLNQV